MSLRIVGDRRVVEAAPLAEPREAAVQVSSPKTRDARGMGETRFDRTIASATPRAMPSPPYSSERLARIAGLLGDKALPTSLSPTEVYRAAEAKLQAFGS